jgi:hypothetical protein
LQFVQTQNLIGYIHPSLLFTIFLAKTQHTRETLAVPFPLSRSTQRRPQLLLHFRRTSSSIRLRRSAVARGAPPTVSSLSLAGCFPATSRPVQPPFIPPLKISKLRRRLQGPTLVQRRFLLCRVAAGEIAASSSSVIFFR